MRYVAAILGIALSATTLSAQTTARDTGSTPEAANVSRGRIRVAGRTARTEGTPRSFQIVRIAVPPEVTDVERVDYEVKPVNEFAVIGRLVGTVRPRASQDLLVTIAVPASAQAGTRAAARVYFRSPDTEVEVPIEMTVRPVFGLTLHAPADIRDLRPGARFDVPVRVQNRGNAQDTVRLQIELPVGWRMLSRDSSHLIVPAHSVRDRLLRVEVPENSGSGSFFIRMFALSNAASAQALLTLTVGAAIDQGRPPGPAVRATLGTVAVEGEAVEAVSQFSVTGPLTNEINIDGRVTTTPDLSGALVRGLARIGTFISAPHLTAWTADWRFTAGSTMLAMTDLTGINAGGRGFSWDFNNTTRSISVVAARSDANAAANSEHGELFGARYEQNLPTLRIGATATHLNGVGLQHHQLSALGVRARTYQRNSLTLDGEMAYRDYTGGSGFGWSGTILHERAGERAELRVTHAPGGADAFARAEREVQASFAKNINERLDMAATFVRAADNAVESRGFSTSAISFTPSYMLTEVVRLRADLRHTSFDMDAVPIGYGSGETVLTFGVSGLWRGFNYSTDAGLGRVSRSVSTEEFTADDAGARFTWRGSATRPSRFGVLQLEGSYERNAAATGYMPEQFLLSARSENIQIPSLSSRLQFDGEITMQTWSNIKPMMLLRAGANYSIGFDTDLAVSLERNPLLSGLREKAPWVVAFKIEKSVGVPRMSVGRAAGVVYRDFNGNGRREEGEPGEPDIAVRRGTARATTSSDGSFRFWERSSGEIMLDPSTLPFGWLVGERKDGNIALIPTTRVEVTLELGAAERLRNIDMTMATVIARDMSGREWTGRRVGSDVAVFEALPVGTYRIDADFSALVEPLRVSDQEVVVQVVEGKVAKVTLPVAGRPLRFRQKS